MTGRTRRLAFAASFALLTGWPAALPSAAQTNAGDVSKIGGQGLDIACHDENLANKANWGDDGTPPLGSARFNFNSFTNVHSIAVDAGGTNVFVPDRSVVRGLLGPVAGVAGGDPVPSSTSTTSTLPGTPRGLVGAAAEGADPRAVALKPIAVAVDAGGDHLYVLEPNAVRQVNLRATPPAIYTIAGSAVGTTVTAGVGSGLAADKFGHVFLGDSSGALYRLDAAGKQPVRLGALESGSISVDAGGTALYGVTENNTVSRIDPVSGATSKVAGGGTATSDGVPATSALLTTPIAVAVDPLGGHLYISDGSARIRMVDLATGIINTVVGSGQSGYQAEGEAASFSMNVVRALAVDLVGNVYMLVPDDCAIFMAVTPAVIFTPPPPTNPPAPQPPPSTPSAPTSQESSNPGGHTAPQTVGGGNQSPGAQQGGAPANQPQVGQGDHGAAVNPQTELRIIDQGNVVTTPDQVAQGAVNPGPTPAGAAQFTPTPAPAPAPTPSPTPTPDAGTVTLVDPGASNAAAVADPSAVALPAAPAAAPVPPPAASAPLPPAAPQPVSNVGLAHGDSPAPARGATRYAMVRNDEEQSVAGLAMAGAGALAAIFLCVMFVAPGASSKPKPRPKGAY